MYNFDEVVESCRYLLNNSPEAEESLNYLNSRLNFAAQEEFSFGYFPNIKNLNLISSLVSEEKLKSLKLLSEYEMRDSVAPRTIYYNYFENHPLILPCKDVSGNIVGLIGRSLLNDEDRSAAKIQKYKFNMDFKKADHVFGLYEARHEILKKDFVYVVEGQFDVIKAREKGIYNVVSIGGSDMSIQQVTLIARYTKNIYLLLDNDEAGENGRTKAIKKFGQLTNMTSLYLPSGYKDIDEYLKDNNADSLTFVIKNAKYYL